MYEYAFRCVQIRYFIGVSFPIEIVDLETVSQNLCYLNKAKTPGQLIDLKFPPDTQAISLLDVVGRYV